MKTIVCRSCSEIWPQEYRTLIFLLMGQGQCCARLRVAWCLQGFLICVLGCFMRVCNKNGELWVLCVGHLIHSEVMPISFTEEIIPGLVCPREVSLGQLPLDRSQKQAILECNISRPQCQAEKTTQSNWSTGPLWGGIGVFTRYLLCSGYEDTLWYRTWADRRALLGKCFPHKHESLTSIPQNHMKKLGTVVGTQHPSIRAMEVAGPSDTTGQPV